MWPTSEGDRTLCGSEASLLAHAIDTMLDPLVDYLDSEDGADPEATAAVLQTGIAVFDSLSIAQRIAVLHHAAHHLFTDTPFPSESLSAADDATIAAIYSEVRDQVEIEIDFFKGLSPSGAARALRDADQKATHQLRLMHWRRLVHDACCDVLGDGAWSRLSSETELASLQLGEWELWIDCLASAILWDRDFEFADSFLDADPDAARRRRRVLGISEDYFIRPAPDPTYRQIERMIRQTRRLVRSISGSPSRSARPLEDDPIS